MAQKLTRIYELQVKADQYNRQMKEVAKNTASVERRLGGIQRGFILLSRATAGIFAVRQVSQYATSIIKTADNVALLEASFGQLLKSGERGADMLDRVYAIADEVGVPLAAVGGAAQQLAVGMQALGNTNAEIAGVVENVLKLGRIGGKGIEDTTSAMYQLSQAISSGRLAGDEYRSVMERIPLVGIEIAKYLDVGIDKLKEMSKQGLLTSDVIVNSILGASEEIDKSFASLPAVWEQGVARINTAFTRLSYAIVTATDGSTKLSKAMGALAGRISGTAESIDDLVDGFGRLGELFDGALVTYAIAGGSLLGLAKNAKALAGVAATTTSAFSSLKAMAKSLRFAGLLAVLFTLATNLDRVKRLVEGLAAALGGIAFDDLPRRYADLIKQGQKLQDLEREYAQRGGDENPRLTSLRLQIREQRRLYEETKRQLEADRELLDQLNTGEKAAAKPSAWVDRAKKLAEVLQKAEAAAEKLREKGEQLAREFAAELDPILELFAGFENIEIAVEWGGFAPADADLLKIQRAKEYLDELINYQAPELTPFDQYALDITAFGDAVGRLAMAGVVVPTEYIIERVNAIRESMDTLKAEVDEYINFGAGEYDEYIADLEAMRDGWLDQVEPVRVLERNIRKLNELLDNGLINEGEFAKIVGQWTELGEATDNWKDKLVDAVKGFQTDFVNTIVDGVAEGKLAFDDLLDHVLKVFAKMALDAALSPIFDAFSTAIGGLGRSAGPGSLIAVPAGGAPSPFTRAAVVHQPMTVGAPRAATYGGLDAFSTQDRGVVNVTVNNNAQVSVEVEQVENNKGGVDLDILIEEKVNRAMSTGGLDKVMQSNYGIARRAF